MSMLQNRGLGLGIGPGLGGFLPSSTIPILDLFPGANGAYSFRLLSSTYLGACCRIRRSSDNAETDINFINGYVDSAAMVSFTSGGLNAFITTWYDQSGNANNMVSTTASQQPQIVSVGAVWTKNGFVAGRYDGVTVHLGRATLSSGYPFSVFSVAQSLTNASNSFGVVSGSYNADNFKWWASVINRGSLAGGAFGSTNTTQSWIDVGSPLANTNVQVTGINTSGANGVAGLNGTTVSSTSLTGSYFPLSTTDIGIVWRASNPINWGVVGFVEEVIHYAQDKTSIRANIENNQKAFYAI